MSDGFLQIETRCITSYTFLDKEGPSERNFLSPVVVEQLGVFYDLRLDLSVAKVIPIWVKLALSWQQQVLNTYGKTNINIILCSIFGCRWSQKMQNL